MRKVLRCGLLPVWLLAAVWIIASVSLLQGEEAAAAPSAPPLEIDIPVQSRAYGLAFFDDTAREFEKARPDVRVVLTGSARIDEKVRVQVMADDLPDATDAVLLYDVLIDAGKIADLSPYLDGPDWEGTGPWRDRFLPGVLQRWSRGEQVYGVPFAHAVWAIFYNKTLFAEHGWEIPRTWDEFYALCEKIRAAGIAPLTLPSSLAMRYGDAFLRSAYFNLVGPEGYRAYQELAPGARSDPRFIRAAEVQQIVSTRYLLHGWEGMSHTAAAQAFLDGKSAMTVAGSWLGSEIRGKVPPGVAVGAMNFPVFPDGIAHPDTLQVQSGYYFVFKNEDPARERAAVDFFRFLTSRENAQSFVRRQDASSALRDVDPADHSEPMREIAALIDRAPASFDGGQPTSQAFLALVEQSMNDLRQQLMTGRITPREYGERLEAAAAAQRARQENPEQVKVKHVGKALALLGVLTLGIAWLVWVTLRQRRLRGEGAARPEAQLGRLRTPVAAVFVGPALLVFGLLVILPALQSLVWAFTRWDGVGGDRTFVGAFNFEWLLLESDTFWYALKNNFYLMIVPTLAVVPLSLFLAALIHRGVWGANFFRAVFLFPNLLGGIAATLLWMNAYDPHGGLVNTALVKLGALTGSEWLQSFAAYPWLSQENLYRALIPIYLWMACGFNLVLYLAAMQGINPELYEAAEIDGAPAWRQFFTITLPLIWDVLAISAVFIVVAGLNTFEMVWLLTSQNPLSGSHVLSTLMVSTMFREFEIGRATAIAVVMFVLVLIGSAVVLRVMRRREQGSD